MKVDQVNTDVGSWAEIKRFHLLPDELTRETEALTPLLQVKRRVVTERDEAAIQLFACVRRGTHLGRPTL